MEYHLPSMGRKTHRLLLRNANHVQPSHNGFINTVLDAYVHHNHLVLRPEDHSENLRKYFVDHAGKKKLKIYQDELDMKSFVLQMTHLIAENVKDASLREWIMPSFTTTTTQDKITAAIIMMGTMQEYFVYMCEETCGIPSVTLLGEKSDWEDILERVQFLGTFGAQHEELLNWNSVLTTLMTKFVRTFDAPDSPEVVKFWQSSVHDYVQGYTGYRILGELRWDEVPAGHVHVPIHVNSFGDKYMAKAIACSIGWKVVNSGDVFSVTRRTDLVAVDPPKPTEARSKEMPKAKKMSEPSMFSDTTLVASTHKRKPGVLKFIAQKLSCFHSNSDQISEEVTSRAWKLSTREAYPVQDTSIAPPRNNLWLPGAEDRPREQLSKRFPSEPISDLSELRDGWQYESGGKRDTLQPVTGWWIVRSPEGEYGRDPACPDVQFDSDAEDYDDEWARGVQGLIDD
ncbi:hypothetical protein K491DRAFT_718502 [Lophiostoma macrostomum CBS 122681]|uniref:Uncharacterized protein n=1 Tax=Lophiostoma macrostomum CBS 122681 TaxID=1314788 RepID=A0A6A6SZH0_9PLEO|nr:hypothetical protein K491DRAFT_718502 [Lophiostoma macrostomum CBS 122681]